MTDIITELSPELKQNWAKHDLTHQQKTDSTHPHGKPRLTHLTLCIWLDSWPNTCLTCDVELLWHEVRSTHIHSQECSIQYPGASQSTPDASTKELWMYAPRATVLGNAGQKSPLYFQEQVSHHCPGNLTLYVIVFHYSDFHFSECIMQFSDQYTLLGPIRTAFNLVIN